VPPANYFSGHRGKERLDFIRQLIDSYGLGKYFPWQLVVFKKTGKARHEKYRNFLSATLQH
jgi:hypothetical protein